MFTSFHALLHSITVAASDRNDIFYDFSNRGDCVDIIAPVSNIGPKNTLTAYNNYVYTGSLRHFHLAK